MALGFVGHYRSYYINSYLCVMITIDNIRPEELVCRHIYSVHGRESLKFADERLLKWLQWFRKTIKQEVYINNWNTGGQFSQRGYRCNLCSLVAEKTATGKIYASAHTRFQAVDFEVDDMSSEEVRQWIDRNKENMPVNIRIERSVNWVHVDVASDSIEKITYFNG